MGKKKNKGGGKAVVMSLAEFEKEQFSKPTNAADFGSILEGAPKPSAAPKKKNTSLGMGSSLLD